MTHHPHSPRPRLLTLLTRPVATDDWRHLLKWVWERRSRVPWEGHRALAVNTLRGLRQIGQPSVLNPLRLSPATDAVLVVWAPRTIEWLVQHPRRSRFTLALAPTAVTTVVSQFPHLAAMADGIDLVLPASPWQQKRFEDTDATAAFAHKYRIWPAGVDTDWWSPGRREIPVPPNATPAHHASKPPTNTVAPNPLPAPTLTSWWDKNLPPPEDAQPRVPADNRKHRLLIYHKRCPDGVLDMVRETAGELDWEIREIHYGHYSPEQFRNKLRGCELAVFLSDWESQGIALAEAWSCDVPTLAWTSDKYYPLKHVAPYLSPATGQMFEGREDLQALLAGAWKTETLQPRKWVLENMSLERSAEILLDCLTLRPVRPA